MKIAIHTVLILKENIKFLAEWISYHYILGVDRFYLYDNTGVEAISEFDKTHCGGKKGMIPGKINKYGINYDIMISNDEMQKIKSKIQKLFPDGVVNFIKWQPKNKNGNIVYGQNEAINNMIKQLQNENYIDWLISIDCDEYIVCELTLRDLIEKSIIKRGASCGVLTQVLYPSRFINKNKLVLEMCCHKKQEFLSYNNSPKCIYKLTDTVRGLVHDWIGKNGTTKVNIESSMGYFNHYKIMAEEKAEFPSIIKKTLIFEVNEYLAKCDL